MWKILSILLLGAGLVCAQTAQFPGAIATMENLLVAKDRSSSTLSSGIDASTLSVPVVAGAQFIAHEIVTIDDEQMQICSIQTNTLTICTGKRGFGGTTAAVHSSGAAVDGNVAAWHHNALSAEVRATQTALGASLSNVVKMSAYGCSFDGGGSVIAGNSTCYTRAHRACTITGWSILATGTAPTMTVDVWKVASGTALPTVANTITANAKPALATGNAIKSTMLTGWNTAVTADDILGLKIDSAANALTSEITILCQ